MRALLPVPAGGTHPEVDVHAHYATDWLDRGGLRVNFVTAVDGAVSAAGLSRGLQTPGDNTVFAALRDLADVVHVGSGTAVAEGYGPVRLSARRQAVRRSFGLAEVLPVAVQSRSLQLDPQAELFTAAEPGARTIVLTCAAADPGRRQALEAVADVVDCGDETVDPALARRALEDRGYSRILSEGGPSVFADLAGHGLVDELCLSISPTLGGPGPGRITAGAEWTSAVPLTLAGLLEDDGALFCRYRTVERGRPVSR
ncbi:pyrimidine reductase family protein [uncultured Jatrophihabitans sp.]|uniref:pyrimidine reductase family protein n=1 Tax=uncultured Jatrophihabitans sp. TaxID=1610747 RepID=UPI0035CB7D3C